MQLQHNSIKQAATVADIYEQQVLDNLARFVVNPYATPAFSVVSQATNGVKDDGNVGISDGGFTQKFWGHVSLGGTRSMDQTFSFLPVTDPARLQLMQCAFQRAVGLQENDCNKCCAYITAWTGRADACYDPCGISCGWVRNSECWKDVPKCCCKKYGKYCGKYVWADPCYPQEFSKLVMTVIDYAAGNATVPTAEMKEVVLYLDAGGGLTKQGEHAQEVRVVVPKNASQAEIEKSLALAATVNAKETKLKQIEMLSNMSGSEREQALNSAKQENPSYWAKPSGTATDSPEEQIKRAISEARSDLDNARAELDAAPDRAYPQSTPQIIFGPPTQFNGFFGGGNLLQLRQNLDTVPFGR